jgi:hypothetical protein
LGYRKCLLPIVLLASSVVASGASAMAEKSKVQGARLTITLIGPKTGIKVGVPLNYRLVLVNAGNVALKPVRVVFGPAEVLLSGRPSPGLETPLGREAPVGPNHKVALWMIKSLRVSGKQTFNLVLEFPAAKNNSRSTAVVIQADVPGTFTQDFHRVLLTYKR